jgi:hypothetical protein
MTATKIEEELPEYTNVLLRVTAKIISYLLHPIFLPLYVVYFLLFIHPTAFAGFSVLQKYQTLVIICLNLIFFPLMSVFLLKAVGFINSIFLKTQKDRIIPYIACGIFFFGPTLFLRNRISIPEYWFHLFWVFFSLLLQRCWPIFILK